MRLDVLGRAGNTISRTGIGGTRRPARLTLLDTPAGAWTSRRNQRALLRVCPLRDSCGLQHGCVRKAIPRHCRLMASAGQIRVLRRSSSIPTKCDAAGFDRGHSGWIAQTPERFLNISAATGLMEQSTEGGTGTVGRVRRGARLPPRTAMNDYLLGHGALSVGGLRR